MDTYSGRRLCLAQDKLSGRSAAFEVRLNEQGGIRQSGLFYFYFNLGGASGIGDRLGVEGRCAGPRETKCQARARSSCASFGDPQLRREIVFGVYGLGIQP